MAKKSKASIATAMGVDNYVRPLPSLCLDENQVSGISQKKVGDTVTFTITAEVTGVRKDKWLKGNPIHVDLDVTSIDGKKTKREVEQPDTGVEDD